MISEKNARKILGFTEQAIYLKMLLGFKVMAQEKK